eukprot:GHVP01027048.1.p1 GENE.GHVP01027048.1~~GHVP01027048.1.p1  ORF type:complete len:589 (-),score=137.83 GHVP01027048.1:1534-3300(-)
MDFSKFANEKVRQGGKKVSLQNLSKRKIQKPKRRPLGPKQASVKSVSKKGHLNLSLDSLKPLENILSIGKELEGEKEEEEENAEVKELLEKAQKTTNFATRQELVRQAIEKSHQEKQKRKFEREKQLELSERIDEKLEALMDIVKFREKYNELEVDENNDNVTAQQEQTSTFDAFDELASKLRYEKRIRSDKASSNVQFHGVSEVKEVCQSLVDTWAHSSSSTQDVKSEAVNRKNILAAENWFRYLSLTQYEKVKNQLKEATKLLAYGEEADTPSLFDILCVKFAIHAFQDEPDSQILGRLQKYVSWWSRELRRSLKPLAEKSSKNNANLQNKVPIHEVVSLFLGFVTVDFLLLCPKDLTVDEEESNGQGLDFRFRPTFFGSLETVADLYFIELINEAQFRGVIEMFKMALKKSENFHGSHILAQEFYLSVFKKYPQISQMDIFQEMQKILNKITERKFDPSQVSMPVGIRMLTPKVRRKKEESEKKKIKKARKSIRSKSRVMLQKITDEAVSEEREQKRISGRKVAQETKRVNKILEESLQNWKILTTSGGLGEKAMNEERASYRKRKDKGRDSQTEDQKKKKSKQM